MWEWRLTTGLKKRANNLISDKSKVELKVITKTRVLDDAEHTPDPDGYVSVITCGIVQFLKTYMMGEVKVLHVAGYITEFSRILLGSGEDGHTFPVSQSRKKRKSIPIVQGDLDGSEQDQREY
jgi:hypothetical protein